jgi:hypothetical protein
MWVLAKTATTHVVFEELKFIVASCRSRRAETMKIGGLT